MAEGRGDVRPADARLRVLHVVSHFPPDRVGGVGEVAAHVHRALLERGHESHVLTTGHTADDPAIRRVAPHTGAGFARASTAHVDWASSFDIVHFHHGEALPLLWRLRHRDPRILLTLHVDNRSLLRATRPRSVDGRRVGSWRTAARKGLVLGTAKVAFDAVARRVADRVTFISRFGAGEVTGSAAGCEVIHNGVVVPTQVTAPASRQDATLLYVGTTGPSKRTAVLPRLMQRVRALVPDARIVVAGFDPADQPALMAEVAELGLDDAFDFVGILRSEELGPLYRSATALVVPSSYEGIPMVVLEAMSHRLPVVATRAGGIAEAVTDGVHGRLVDVDDLDALAAAAAAVLLDPATAATMGDAGRRRVIDQFDVGRQIDSYLDVYHSMVRH